MQVELVNDGPVTIILDTKIDKKDQAQPAWFFSSIIKCSKKKSVLDRAWEILFQALASAIGRDDVS